MNMNFQGMKSFTPYRSGEPIKCPICEKMFTPAPEHSYRIDEGVKCKLVCSYTCMRTWEKKPKKPLGTAYNGKRIPVRVVETGEEYTSFTACAKALKVSNSSVYLCVYHGRTVKGLHIEKVYPDD